MIAIPPFPQARPRERAARVQEPRHRRRHQPSRSPLRKAAGEDARRPDRSGSVQRLDLARQPGPVQLVHDRHGQGRDSRVSRRVECARRQLRRVHRRGRQGLLHRRQHQGVRRVLRRPPAGVSPVHAAVQRHGVGDPRLRQAGDLPRQRHAHRRRPGNRHGLRLFGGAGSRALRPGRPEARLGADRRRHRFSCR